VRLSVSAPRVPAPHEPAAATPTPSETPDPDALSPLRRRTDRTGTTVDATATARPCDWSCSSWPADRSSRLAGDWRRRPVRRVGSQRVILARVAAVQQAARRSTNAVTLREKTRRRCRCCCRPSPSPAPARRSLRPATLHVDVRTLHVDVRSVDGGFVPPASSPRPFPRWSPWQQQTSERPSQHTPSPALMKRTLRRCAPAV